MTDFERMWDGLQTGEPPVDTIVVEARRREVLRRRRRTAVVGAAAVAAAFSGGVLVAKAPSGTIGFGDARPVAFAADLRPAQSCDELLASYRDRGAAIVTAWGWPSDAAALNGGSVAEDTATPLAAAKEPQNSAGTDRGQVNSQTGTNVQEVGVDEPDRVKTNGTLLVRFREGDLLIYDVSGTSVERLARLRIPAVGDDAQLLLIGKRVIVIGSGRSDGAPTTRVVSVSVAEPEHPEVSKTVRFDGRLLSARQHGDDVRMVLAAGLPDLDFVRPDADRSDQRALAENRKVIEQSRIGDWLGQYRVGGDEHPLLDCGNVAVPPSDPGLDTVSIVGLAAGAIDDPRAIGLAASTTIAYESADHLYLASSPTTSGCSACRMLDDSGSIPPEVGVPSAGHSSGTSRIYDFRLDGVDASHVASGEVEGVISDRWAMDEAHGVLRVAVGPSSETGDFNSVVTFRKNGDDLLQIGRLDGLGAHEQLHGMRWFDDYAFLVTYRQSDPLLSIGLSDPTHPRLLGELKVPGFSDYLHPIGGSRILGVGQADDGAMQIGLFDARDLSQVARTASVVVPGAWALAGDDPRTFTWLPDTQTALLVVLRGPEVLIDAVRADGTRLSSSVQRVEYGDDAWSVRTMELPDGRVVLVTGEDVRFLPQ
jgi:hypothetical protein